MSQSKRYFNFDAHKEYRFLDGGSNWYRNMSCGSPGFKLPFFCEDIEPNCTICDHWNYMSCYRFCPHVVYLNGEDVGDVYSAFGICDSDNCNGGLLAKASGEEKSSATRINVFSLEVCFIEALVPR